ncbi:ABC transporter ATP-binding protein [Paenibacillus thalictri]|uniref:ABC transporter ATP-binding protein n=1 Tax=Paenibacillus thalictri TaxID=2527873 RepID=A0A4Q9DF73_9BACL|nr:ATP-binding cassette domain-containing protein [Paenibacillus thalictri]TBL69905.1 ABC transporter ATP-binding protein [Paenibacillus thalictri]
MAAALIPEPSLLIADEPTTALDVVTGEHIMDLIADLRTETGCGVLFITHDLRHVWRRADRLAVMKEGVIVDSGTALELRDSPVHPYTRELLDASYRLTGKPTYLPEAASLSEPATEYLKAVGLSKQYGGAAATERAVDRVSLRISEGECIGLVGESGCGKSTLARLLLALEQPEHGAVLFREQALAGASKQALRQFRRHVQVVFQDSASSLNDRLPIWRSVLEPLDNYKDAQPVFFEGLQLSRREKALRLLRITGLDEEHMDRYPHELSGGQRQRACISRGISLCPQLLICDEPTSSLDMPTQRQILNLLKRLQRELGMSLLFISHDLAAVGQLCDRLLVMKEGKIVDEFAATELWSEKRHPYTRLLISAAL